MYRVRYCDGDGWRIVSGADETMFVGNKLQAEEWLDYQENVQRQPRGDMFQEISVNQQNVLSRTAVTSTWLVTWGVALYGALLVGQLNLPWQHGICGPWGCGPPPQALAACHLFWLVLLGPPALIVSARFPPMLVGKMSWVLAGTGTVGIAAIVLYESTTWLPQALESQRWYFTHRCLFAVATLVEVPLVETLILGVAMRAISFGRAAPDLPRTAPIVAAVRSSGTSSTTSNSGAAVH